MGRAKMAEAERVRMLRGYRILDTAPDTGFDALARAASRALGMPVSFVSLVDDTRQWFKATVGIDVRESPRDVSFCHHTIQNDDVLVVEDATRDPRFSDNPFVTGEMGLRFYAGAPLMAAPGLAIGSLCVVDVKPHRIAPLQVALLKDLADAAMGLVRGHLKTVEAEEAEAVLQDKARDLAISDAHFRQSERMAGVGGWTVDVIAGTVAWSPNMATLHGLPSGGPPDLAAALGTMPALQAERIRGILTDGIDRGAAEGSDRELRLPDGTRRWVRDLTEVHLAGGRPVRIVGTVQDVTARHETETRLWAAAHRDALTHLPNRNAFNAALADALAPGRAPPALLMVDADRLKRVNDTLGHEAGDALIVAIADRLSSVATPGATVARLGGDEFALLMPGPVRESDVTGAAMAALTAVAAPMAYMGVSVPVEVSIGGALARAAEGAAELCGDADLALYQAKRDGRGGFSFYDERHRSTATARAEAVATVDRALIEGRVVAWYQPVFDLATGRLSSVEALARVWDGDRCHSIGEYAEALVDRRTATRVTEAVLRSIAVDAAAWEVAGTTPPRIAFNVGSRDFQEGRIEALLDATCMASGLDASRFALEVTESVFLSRDSSIVSDVARRLRQRGVIIALDDFGTGYASLAHLGSFPVDVMKMDRSFVTKMTDDGPGAAITQTLIELAHRLGIWVIAEGVETQEQADRLSALGCEKVQGWLYAKAMSAADIRYYITMSRSRERQP